MTITRAGVLAAFLVAAPMALHAMDLDVGIGSAAFRDPKDPACTFYTVSEIGPR